MLAGWKGSGGEAYREHLAEIGKSIEELIATAGDVSGALSRIDGDLRKAVAYNIPHPDDRRLRVDPAERHPTPTAPTTRRALRISSRRCARTTRAIPPRTPTARSAKRPMSSTRRRKSPRAGRRQQTRRSAEHRPAAGRVVQCRNQQLANDAMSPLRRRCRPHGRKLVVARTGPARLRRRGHPRRRGRLAANRFSRRRRRLRQQPRRSRCANRRRRAHRRGRAGQRRRAAPARRPRLRLARSRCAGGIGGGAAGGMGMGAVPGMVGGGNGRVPPMTSPASALRSAASASTGPRPLPGQESMGYGDPATDRLDWSFRDDDPWGAYEPAPPGILR